MQVYIAGKGIISAMGCNTLQNLESLRNAASGIKPISILNTHHAADLPAGEVKLSNAHLADLAGLSPEFSRTVLLSMIAAKEAISSAQIDDIKRWRTGFISATTVGGMDLTENFMAEFLADNSKGNLADVVNHDSGSAAQIMSAALGINDYISTLSTACSSSANSIMYAARLIKSNVLDIAVAGGADPMLRFTLNGFNALGLLDKQPCRPFDETRAGLNLGEGAAYLVLVSSQIAATLANKPRAVLSGYANANDAFHQTASSAEGHGNYLAMQAALAAGGLQAADIDYINLHGTGTSNNDISEGIAIQKVFGDNVPPAASTKAFTGHTLGASGAIEAVFSILSIEEKMIFPNLRFKKRMKELNFSPLTELLVNQKVQHIMSNSFGFGGNCSSLIFSATS